MNQHQKFLLYCADTYYKLGYKIGLTKEKALVAEYEPCEGVLLQRALSSHQVQEWDGISIILRDLMCVDIDSNEVKIEEALPPLSITWTEKTKRGWHYIYRLPKDNHSRSCKVSWRPNVDLLVYNPSRTPPAYRNERGISQSTWFGHILVSPTNGYTRTAPQGMIAYGQLPSAPSWILEALQ